MKVLVTGATGFIGRHLIPALLGRGHAVTAVVRDQNRARAFDWYDRVDVLCRDIYGSPESPGTSFGRPDVIVHLAWPSLTDFRAVSHFEEYLAADYRFLKSLVDVGIGRILVAGTCLEYGIQNGALAAHAPTLPVVPYGIAKDALRRFLQQLQRERSFVLQWARLFYMYGNGQNPSSLLAQLDRAIEAQKAVFDMSGGEQLRDYLPVEAVAAQLCAIVDHPEWEGVTNVCSGQPISVRRLVEEHIARRGADIRLNLGHFPYPDYEPLAFWGESRFELSMDSERHARTLR